MFTLFVPFGDGSETCFDPGPPATARPLVLNWHGCNRHLPVIDYHLDISRMNERAADFSWFTITPLGTTLLNTSGDILGNYGWDAHGCCPCHEIGIDDFAFANALLDWAQAHLCVDMSNVFTTGFSNGAYMSYSLGCELAERFAGIAVNAGSIYRSRMAACARGKPVPVISFHSRTDPVVPYDGSWNEASQDEIDAMHRKRAGCNGAEVSTVTVNTTTTKCVRTECHGSSERMIPIETCTVEGLNHCWIGGRSGGFNRVNNCQRRSGDVDATTKMLQFWSVAKNITNPQWLQDMIV